MVCSSCKDRNFEDNRDLDNFLVEELVPFPENIHQEEEEEGQNWCTGIICKTCKEGVALKLTDGQWHTIEDILSKNDTNLNGWLVTHRPYDRWLQGVLNNVIYYMNEPPNEKENETDYSLPCADDQVWRCS